MTLDRTETCFDALRSLVAKARQRAQSDMDSAVALFPWLEGHKREVADGAFQELEDLLEEAAHLALVSCFEKESFALLQSSLDQAQMALEKHYEGPVYFPFRRSLVHEIDKDINDLGRLRTCILSDLPVRLGGALARAIEVRASLAHGRRPHVGSADRPPMARETAAMLREVLNLVRGTRA